MEKQQLLKNIPGTTDWSNRQKTSMATRYLIPFKEAITKGKCYTALLLFPTQVLLMHKIAANTCGVDLLNWDPPSQLFLDNLDRSWSSKRVQPASHFSSTTIAYQSSLSRLSGFSFPFFGYALPPVIRSKEPTQVSLIAQDKTSQRC